MWMNERYVNEYHITMLYGTAAKRVLDEFNVHKCPSSVFGSRGRTAIDVNY